MKNNQVNKDMIKLALSKDAPVRMSRLERALYNATIAHPTEYLTKKENDSRPPSVAQGK